LKRRSEETKEGRHIRLGKRSERTRKRRERRKGRIEAN
jgi:hypothetical protein